MKSAEFDGERLSKPATGVNPTPFTAYVRLTAYIRLVRLSTRARPERQSPFGSVSGPAMSSQVLRQEPRAIEEQSSTGLGAVRQI